MAQRFEGGSSGLFGSELGGKWKSEHDILSQYRFIRLGYFLLGDDGIMNAWRFRGAARLRSLTGRIVGYVTHAVVPGWYDTHARHSCALQERTERLRKTAVTELVSQENGLSPERRSA